MTDVLIPRLKVGIRPDGSLVLGHNEGAIQPIDDGWWIDVLHDPRARVPTATSIDSDDRVNAHYRLDRQKPLFAVRCACGRHDVLDRDKLITQVGGGMNVVYLVREYMDCGARNKMSNWCRAYVAR